MTSLSAAAAPTPNDMYSVGLNLKPDKPSGLVFVGSPPRLSSFDESVIRLPSGQPTIINYYLEAIVVPGLEMFKISSDTKAQQILVDFQDGAREIILNSHPPTGLEMDGVKCMYKYDLPESKDLGLELDGFPPKVVAVQKSSEFYGKIEKDQFVESVILPDGRPLLNRDTPEFCGAMVQRRLEETNHVKGRQLVLKDLTEEGIKRAAKTKTRPPESAPDDNQNGFWKGCCCM